MKTGDVFLTRSLGGIANIWPGYWNHAAIWTGKSVIESLMPVLNEPYPDFKGGVVEQSFDKWLENQVHWSQWRCVDEKAAKKAAKHAFKMVGKRYSFTSSLRHWFGFKTEFQNVNCLSVLRLCYQKGFGEDPVWRITDDIMYDPRFEYVP